MLAAIAIAGLLLTFHQVVSGAVRQGEMRHAAALAQHNALWRCNQRPDRDLRHKCRQQLASAAVDPAAQPSTDPRGATVRLVLNRPDRAKE